MTPLAVALVPTDARLGAVRDRVESVFTSRAGMTSHPGTEHLMVWDLARSRSVAGKFVRPSLVIAAYDALCDGHTVSLPVLIEAASMVELLHLSFLLHDDLIDADTDRRGDRNLIGAAFDAAIDQGVPSRSAQRWGEAVGLLVGDALLSHVHTMAWGLELDAPARIRLGTLLAHAISDSIAGEISDVALGHGICAPTAKTVMDTALRKTAVYSVELPVRVGVILAGASPRLEELLAPITQAIGVAYQLQDDLRNLFADPRDLATARGTDIREAKQTMIMLHARSTSAWRVIEPLWGKGDLTEEQCCAVGEALTRSGSRAAVERQIALQLDSAHRGIRELDATTPVALIDLLSGLAEQVGGRHR